jgi:iron-sulfur cluster repair protein YtfE (RIC family)
MNEFDDVRPTTVTEILGSDHRRLDAMLAEVKRALAAGRLEWARARFGDFRRGLERHIEVEEEVLFPGIEQLPGAPGGGPIQVMRGEHEELRRLLVEVADHLVEGGGELRAAPMAALTALIFAHNGKEERVLYPEIDRAAPGAAMLEELVERLRTL